MSIKDIPDYEPEGFSKEIFTDRYAFTEGETWKEMCARVSKQVAMAEVPEKVAKYQEKFYDILIRNLFVPGGRILYGSGRPKPALINCFLLRDDLDSKNGWGDLIRENIITAMSGGGSGQDFSDIRPEGAEISGHRGTCSGPLGLMSGVNAAAKMVRAGGGRRAANMFSLDLHHPDVLKFLDAKLKNGELDMANVSLRSLFTRKFIEAVKAGDKWGLSWKGKYKREICAKTLWHRIVRNAWESSEPGFINMELVREDSPSEYHSSIVSSNPCLTGDTQVYVADGRVNVAIKELAREGLDVEVFCQDHRGNVVVRTMRNPRLTGESQKIFKLTLDDGSYIKCTEHHKFRLKTGEYREVLDLQKSDQLSHVTRYHGNIKDIFSEANSNSRDYIWIKDDRATPKQEHRLIAASVYGKISKGSVAHHLDKNPLNNNPANRATAQGYKARLATPAEAADSPKHCQIFITKECEGCKRSFDILYDRREIAFCSPKCSDSRTVGKELRTSPRQTLRSLHLDIYTKLHQDLERDPTQPEWISECELTGVSTSPCNWEGMVGESSQFNYRVESVEFVGFDDVYNGTVDEFHNFLVGGFQGSCANGKPSWGYLTNLQCGEQMLPKYSNCCLGHLVLSRFVKSDGGVDWETMGEVVRVGIRFLDNVLDVNSYPLPEQEVQAKRERRVGLGVTGLSDLLTKLGLRYGSEECNKMVDKIFRFIAKQAYEGSILLAIEKGSFPVCDRDLHVKTGFVKRMSPKIKSMIREHGIRNTALLSVAPTGTVSIISGNCSSGLEPMFSPAYYRNFWKGKDRVRELCFHPLFVEAMESGSNVEHFISASEISPRQHLEVQKVIQKHIDGAVSKTCTIQKNFSVKELSEIWLEYLPYLKGTTFYREGSRNFVDENGVEHDPPLVAIPMKEAVKLYRERAKSNTEAAPVTDCVRGTCEI